MQSIVRKFYIPNCLRLRRFAFGAYAWTMLVTLIGHVVFGLKYCRIPALFHAMGLLGTRFPLNLPVVSRAFCNSTLGNYPFANDSKNPLFLAVFATGQESQRGTKG